MPLHPSRRQRQIINASEDDISGYDLDGKVSAVIDRMNDLIKKYGPDVSLDWDPNYHYPYDESPSPRFWVKVSRPETDDEMATRIAQEEKLLNEHTERERRQYEALKSKFGDK